jgi:hypothetical protein
MPVDAIARLRQLAGTGALDLPLPGAGATPERLRALRALAATEDLSVGRLAEAHTDAIAILREAGAAVPTDALLGVWASNRSDTPVVAEGRPGGWRLQGTKGFCSGASILDAALVTAQAADGERLFLVPLGGAGVRVDLSVWRSPALAATATGAVDLDVELPSEAAVGGPGFYVERPGLWHGAIGVAACWAGGADGVAATVRARIDADDPSARAHLGAVEAARWGMAAVLADVGRAIDADPDDRAGIGFPRALTVHHLIVEHCLAVLSHADRVLGPGPLAFDAGHAQRVMDLRLYLQQHHPDRDLDAIGRYHLAANPPSGDAPSDGKGRAGQ